MVMPAEWMTATHSWLGLGELPRSPAFEYLARSIAALYGFHGVLLLIVASDPRRYRTSVWYVAAMNVLFGLIVLAIDVEAGMPGYWSIAEGPPIVVFGIVIAMLNRSLPPDR